MWQQIWSNGSGQQTGNKEAKVQNNKFLVDMMTWHDENKMVDKPFLICLILQSDDSASFLRAARGGNTEKVIFITIRSLLQFLHQVLCSKSFIVVVIFKSKGARVPQEWHRHQHLQRGELNFYHNFLSKQLIKWGQFEFKVRYLSLHSLKSGKETFRS